MKGNKTYQMIQLVLLLAIFIGLGSVMISWATGHNPFALYSLKGVPFNGPLEKAKEETYALEGIEVLELDVNLADVEIYSGVGSDLKVVESTNDKEKKDLFEISQGFGRILVKRPNSHYVGIPPQHKLEIWLPSSYSSTLIVTTSSGNINLNNVLALEKLETNQSSGNLVAREEIKAKVAQLTNSSGDKQLEKVETETYEFTSSSGKTVIKSLRGKGSCMASSGDISIEELKLNGDAKFTTTSGKLEIGLKTSNTTLEANTSAGDIKGSINWNYEDKRGKEANAQIGNGADYKLKLKTSSGSIYIDEK